MDARFWQRNPIWQDRRLGTSSATIGSAGCLVCAAARMIHNETGTLLTPWELNKRLVEAGGFVSGNLLRFASVPFLPFVDRRLYHDRPFSLRDEAEMAALWATGHRLLVQVDCHPDRAGFQEHWLCVEEIGPGRPPWSPYMTWRCYDPLWGEIVEIGEHHAGPSRHLDYGIWALAIYATDRADRAAGRVPDYVQPSMSVFAGWLKKRAR
jgi:hypothetical protein